MPSLQVSVASTKSVNDASQEHISLPIQDIDYDVIRQICAVDNAEQNIDLSPHVFKQNRIKLWPDINTIGMGQQLASVYQRVRDTGVPNAIGARAQLPTTLNIDAWENNLTRSHDDEELLSYIKYGFPLGYMGPVSNSIGVPNHSSAVNFKDEVDRFISKEIGLGGVIGPMEAPPFQQWTHLSPLMSREKKGSRDALS